MLYMYISQNKLNKETTKIWTKAIVKPPLSLSLVGGTIYIMNQKCHEFPNVEDVLELNCQKLKTVHKKRIR